MQVILLEKIAKLGGLGDLANVKPGYARNYLFPQGKAQPATKANLEAFEKIKKDLEAKEAKVLKDAQAIEKKMTGVVCNIAANASEEGKLFGSISAAEIVQNLADQGFEIERKISIFLRQFAILVNMKFRYHFIQISQFLLRLLSKLSLLRKHNRIGDSYSKLLS